MISIIVPVYNVELYLNTCLDSIRAQTYRNFEVVLVDDGSTDSCGIICDEYSNRDDRFKVIHKKKRWVNVGLEKGLGICKSKSYYVYR